MEDLQSRARGGEGWLRPRHAATQYAKPGDTIPHPT